jgi:geranylgeranyl pyrophosphate synthase
MELSQLALEENPFFALGERYQALHQKLHLKSLPQGLSDQERSERALRWSAEQARRVPGAMGALLTVQGTLARCAEYQLHTEGKLFRGRLALAAARFFQLETEVALQLACATEFIHNASLIHDDIQDQDEMRRNRPTIWRKYGANSALLLGDLFLSKAYEALGAIGASHHRGRFLNGLMGEKVSQLIQGQSDELEHQGDLDLPFSTYEQIAMSKTSVLLSFPVEAVLLLAGRPDPERQRIKRTFDQFGLAYQIHDDIVDLCAPRKGRDQAGSDVREGRTSALILKFWEQASPQMRAKFKRFFQDGERRRDPLQVAFWVQRIADSQALEESFQYLSETLTSCRAEALALPAPLNSFMLLVVSQLEKQIRPTQKRTS